MTMNLVMGWHEKLMTKSGLAPATRCHEKGNVVLSSLLTFDWPEFTLCYTWRYHVYMFSEQRMTTNVERQVEMVSPEAVNMSEKELEGLPPEDVEGHGESSGGQGEIRRSPLSRYHEQVGVQGGECTEGEVAQRRLV